MTKCTYVHKTTYLFDWVSCFQTQVVCDRLFSYSNPALSKHTRTSQRKVPRSVKTASRRMKSDDVSPQKPKSGGIAGGRLQEKDVAPQRTPTVGMQGEERHKEAKHTGDSPPATSVQELSWEEDMGDEILRMLIARANFYDKAIRSV